MKIFKLTTRVLSIALMMLFSISPTFVIDGRAEDGVTRHLLYRKHDNNRPNKPSNSYLEVYHSVGVLYFILPEECGFITVQIYNDTDYLNETVTGVDSIISVSSLKGDYIIECITDDNRCYSGTITL